MVVCKYFQQGSCRYGQNCRNEHVYGNKYNYQAQSAVKPVSYQQQGSVTTEQLLNQVKLDTETALKGKQWLLTAYSPFKEKVNMPGFTDHSFEEIRLMLYEAKASNNLPQATNYFNQQMEAATQKFQKLIEPNAAIIKTLQSIYKGEIPGDPFSAEQQNMTPSLNQATSLFVTAMADLVQAGGNKYTNQQSGNIFNNQNNLSNQQTSMNITDAQKSNVFQNTAVQNLQPSDIFKSAQQSSNIYANQNAQTFGSQNAFATNTQLVNQNPSNVFAEASKSIFSSDNKVSAPGNVFTQNNYQQTSIKDSPFLNTPFSNAAALGSANANVQLDAYSKEDEISPNDMIEFSNDNFRLGFIPEIAPPKSVC